MDISDSALGGGDAECGVAGADMAAMDFHWNGVMCVGVGGLEGAVEAVDVAAVCDLVDANRFVPSTGFANLCECRSCFYTG